MAAGEESNGSKQQHRHRYSAAQAVKRKLEDHRGSEKRSSTSSFMPNGPSSQHSNKLAQQQMVCAQKRENYKSGNAVRRQLETTAQHYAGKLRSSSDSSDVGYNSNNATDSSMQPSASSSVEVMNWGAGNMLAHRRNESDSRIGLLRRQHTDIAMARRSHLFGRSGSILGDAPIDKTGVSNGEPILTNFVNVGDKNSLGSLRRQSSLDSDLHLSSHSNSVEGLSDRPFLHQQQQQCYSPPLLKVPIARANCDGNSCTRICV